MAAVGIEIVPRCPALSPLSLMSLQPLPLIVSQVTRGQQRCLFKIC